MSKTIEIASIHKGNVATKVKGESATIKFEKTDTEGVFLAMCDNDEAGALLAIGKPDFWKPTVNADLDDADLDDEDKDEPVFRTAGAVISDIRAAKSIEEIEALIEGEERKSVLDEAAKKSKVLSK